MPPCCTRMRTLQAFSLPISQTGTPAHWISFLSRTFLLCSWSAKHYWWTRGLPLVEPRFILQYPALLFHVLGLSHKDRLFTFPSLNFPLNFWMLQSRHSNCFPTTFFVTSFWSAIHFWSWFVSTGWQCTPSTFHLPERTQDLIATRFYYIVDKGWEPRFLQKLLLSFMSLDYKQSLLNTYTCSKNRNRMIAFITSREHGDNQ